MNNPPDTSVTERVALLPCPFCGCHGLSAAYPRIIRERACGVVECHTDGCYAMIVHDTLPQAIAAWNTRAAISSMPSLEALEQIKRLALARGGHDWDLVLGIADAALSPRKEDQQ